MTKAADLSALGSNVTTSGNLSSASTLTLQTNSTTAVTVDSSQNVGIGTASPGGKLDITKSTNGNAFVVNAPGGSNPNFIVSGSGEQTFRLYNTASTGSTRTSIKLASRLNTDWEWIILTDGAGTGVNDLYISNLAGTALTIDASRNVGIGTTSPTQKLSVAGTIHATGNGTFPTTGEGIEIVPAAAGGDNYVQAYSRTASSWQKLFINSLQTAFATSGTERMRIDSSGRVTTPYQPAFFAVPTAGFTTTASGSYFSFNSLNSTFCSSNRSSGYNTSTLVYTAPVAGLYQFFIQLYMNNTTISAQWFKNGVGMSYGDAALTMFQSGATTNIINGSVIVELAVGDYIGVQPRNGSATVGYYGGHSCFWGYLIG